MQYTKITNGIERGEVKSFLAGRNCGKSVHNELIYNTLNSEKRGTPMIKIVRLNKNYQKYQTLGIITIASEIADDGKIYYGVSYHNPKDKYDKKMGIDIAVERLKRIKLYPDHISALRPSYNGYFTKPKTVTFNEVLTRICCSIHLANNIPDFAESTIREAIFHRI
jgi:hypothetical protein